MISGYNRVLLLDLITELGEEETKKILSEFSSPNKDVEYFLKHKAIEFAKQRLASTHLIFSSYQGKLVIVGYFSIALKTLRVKKDCVSRNMSRRIKKFTQISADGKSYLMPAPLIAQLSKNFYNGYNNLITGDELLKIACDNVNEFQMMTSGKIVYLECEDNEKIIDFYSSNGFVNFGKRELDKDEKIDGTYLIQMLKYL